MRDFIGFLVGFGCVALIVVAIAEPAKPQKLRHLPIPQAPRVQAPDPSRVRIVPGAFSSVKVSEPKQAPKAAHKVKQAPAMVKIRPGECQIHRLEMGGSPSAPFVAICEM